MPGIGGIVADLLTTMAVANNELDVGPGGSNEAQSIIALVQAQHYFETLAASMPRVLANTINVATLAQGEKSTWTSSLRRLDALWFLDASGTPVRKLKRISDIGGHVPSLPWPLQMAFSSSVGAGAPFAYFADMASFYWLPRPDDVYQLRIYGFLKQPEFVARGDNFNYPLECKLPFAQFAARLLATSVGDDSIEYDKLAAILFRPLIRQFRKFDRSEPQSRYYNEFHTT